MNRLIHSPVGGPLISWWLTWVLLLPLLAGCCKSQEPRELVCKPIAFFEVLEPEKGAGAAPFSIQRFGPEVEEGAVYRSPMYVSFEDDNRGRVEWGTTGVDLFIDWDDFVYSPAEGLGRNGDYPENAYPIKRFFDGKSERVWFGFRSKICRERDAHGGYYYCKPGKEKLFLVADMSCEWWIGGSPPEK